MTTIIYANMLPFICLVGLFFIQRKNHLFDRKQGKLFCCAIYLNLTLLVVISLDYLFYNQLSTIPNVWMIHRVTSFINFAASPAILVLIYSIFTEKKGASWFYAPCVVNGIICFFSIFTNFVFEITVENAYFRGPFFIIPFLTSVFYLVVLIIYSGSSTSFARTGKRSERVLIFVILIVLSTCMILEVFYKFKFLTWDAASYSLIMYYLLISINNSSLDPLTQAYNRAMYMSMLSEIDRTKPCVYALIDIDEFKKVNDLQGHIAGDHFLTRFSLILQREFDKTTKLYRIGGDEFAIISQGWNMDRMIQYLIKTKEIMKKEDMFFSSGIIEYQPDQILDDVIQVADDRMYAEKNERKK